VCLTTNATAAEYIGETWPGEARIEKMYNKTFHYTKWYRTVGIKVICFGANVIIYYESITIGKEAPGTITLKKLAVMKLENNKWIVNFGSKDGSYIVDE
jgi:hypothetical protein